MPLQYLYTVHITFFTVYLKWKFDEVPFFLRVVTVPGGIVATVITVFFSSVCTFFFSFIYKLLY